MSEREKFRSTILAHQAEAEAALALHGDVEPRGGDRRDDDVRPNDLVRRVHARAARGAPEVP